MIYADIAVAVECHREAFLPKWQLKFKVVADSLEEAEDRLFTFTGFDSLQWKSAKKTSAVDRLNEEFRCRTSQDPNHATLCRNRPYAALGAAGVRPNLDVQG